jgi:hypothetical protein
MGLVHFISHLVTMNGRSVVQSFSYTASACKKDSGIEADANVDRKSRLGCSPAVSKFSLHLLLTGEHAIARRNWRNRCPVSRCNRTTDQRQHSLLPGGLGANIVVLHRQTCRGTLRLRWDNSKKVDKKMEQVIKLTWRGS